MWMYHSHTDEVSDTYAGLMGPMEITRRGMARPDGSPKDVDREIFALFSVMNENQSPFLDANIKRFAEPPAPDPDDEDFQESNLMHSINGYVFGNQPMITMHRGEHVRWYVMSMGTEVDLHTPHWHGNTVTVNGMRMDVVSLLPGDDGRRRHGARRRGHLALPLPRQRPHPRRNADPVQGAGVTTPARPVAPDGEPPATPVI